MLVRLLNIAVVITIAASAASLAYSKSGPSQTSPEPILSSSFTITLGARNLEPGTRYAARYTATFDTGRTYTLGDTAQTVRRDGTLRFDIDVADLGYFNHGEELREIEMCITEPQWPYRPVACTDRDVGY